MPFRNGEFWMAIRILLVRIDRMGDVLLTTPIIETIRKELPNAYIAFMTTPKTREIVEGNPWLNEVIIYDRKGEHRGIISTVLFALSLRKKYFDISLIFHPNHRSNWIAFLARIPKRIGYHRKTPRLLTDIIQDEKYKGEKSEAFYNEDFLPFLGIIPPHSQNIHFPLSETAKKNAGRFLEENNVRRPFVVINVSASCPSKIWPSENFALLSNLIYEKLGLDIILIGKKEICHLVQRLSGVPLVIAHEALSLSELAALFQKAILHVSSDTGPLHLASAVETPVISIFGRTLAGLGPKRWGPLKGGHTLFHKDIGCDPCLAHDCKIDFDCLKATKAEDVFHAVQTYQKNSRC